MGVHRDRSRECCRGGVRGITISDLFSSRPVGPWSMAMDGWMDAGEGRRLSGEERGGRLESAAKTFRIVRHDAKQAEYNEVCVSHQVRHNCEERRTGNKPLPFLGL